MVVSKPPFCVGEVDSAARETPASSIRTDTAEIITGFIMAANAR
jgi:hypothetical protein